MSKLDTARASRLIAEAQGTHDLVHVLDLFGDTVDEADFVKAATTFFDLFGIRYIEADDFGTVRYTRQAKLIFEIVSEDGWSKARFQATLDLFRRRRLYGINWFPSDFLDLETAALHPYSWVLHETHKDPAAMRRMQGFRVTGQTLYRYGTEPDLPFEMLTFNQSK